MSQKLRPYQSIGISALRKSMMAGNKRIIFASPTGAGKTTVAAYMIFGAVKKNLKVLFLAHRKELIDQCSARLHGEDIFHGIIKAGYPKSDENVQVASKDTLVRRLTKLPPADLIIVDECHRTLGPSYLKILESYPEAFVIGLTATPYRLDGKGLGNYYQDIIKCSNPQELIDLGYLVPPRIFSSSTTPDLSKVGKIGGDFNEKELEKIYDKPTLIGDIYSHWNRLCRDRLTVIFAVSVEHSKRIRDVFIEHGVQCEHLDGTTANKEREDILHRFQSGQTRVICNVGILTEGWDCPSASALVLARPTTSTGLYLQMAGRTLRPAKGKVDCIILDHAGNVKRHGFPQEDREFSLESSRKVKHIDPDAMTLTTCVSCFAIYKTAVCPACGHVPTIKERIIDQVEGELVEVTYKNKREAFKWLCDRAKKEGRSQSWANSEYKKTFGEYPNFRGIGEKKNWIQSWNNEHKKWEWKIAATI